jgi:hypothetical protein
MGASSTHRRRKRFDGQSYADEVGNRLDRAPRVREEFFVSDAVRQDSLSFKPACTAGRLPADQIDETLDLVGIKRCLTFGGIAGLPLVGLDCPKEAACACATLSSPSSHT